MGVVQVLRDIMSIIKDAPKAFVKTIKDYIKSYRKGVNKFGIWWTVFTFSMWSFFFVFIATTVIIIVYFLPRTII